MQSAPDSGSRYGALARVYHLLFPARPAQLGFLSALAGPAPARLLDVASGTGEYAAALSAQGYGVQAIELDPAMHTAAQARHPALAHCAHGGGRSSLIQGDMRELSELVRGPFALAFCIGNSLPHLEADAGVEDVLAQMHFLTRPDGAVVIQTVNFDHVLAQLGQARDATPHFELPPLSATTEDGTRISLSRRYTLPPASAEPSAASQTGSVLFLTVLRIGETATSAESSLLALTRERLTRCLPRGGRAEWFGGFDLSAWREDSPATVLVLR